jgi:hypothetical protein
MLNLKNRARKQKDLRKFVRDLQINMTKLYEKNKEYDKIA